MISKDFALVHGYFREAGDADGEMVLVPTKEEYNDFKQRIDNRFDVLFKRIEALEGRTGKKTDVYEATMPSIVVSGLKLTGTDEQHKLFKELREEANKILFPRFLAQDDLVFLALNCGLSVKREYRGEMAE